MSHHVPAVRWSQGENIVIMWTCGDGTIGVAPSLEAPYLETRLGFVAVVVVGWWCCPLAAVEEVRMVRVGREVQRI